MRARSNKKVRWVRSAVVIAILVVLCTTIAARPVVPYHTGVAANSREFAGQVLGGTDRVELVVLLESPPVSALRLQLAPAGHQLSVDQSEQVRAYSRDLASTQQAWIEAARQQGLSLTVSRTFRTLLNGLAVAIPTDQTRWLGNLSGVRAIYPDWPVHLELAESVVQIGADQVWALQDELGLSLTGQGVQVAVVDTGIDYTHPDLGGCFGPGCKVSGGYDVFNNDADPMDDNGHGTHCAGIVAADGNLKGVAPGASLLAYKVLDSAGNGTISLIIAGMERAVDPDQDPGTADAANIISMSLGVPGTPEDPWPLAVEAAVELGVMVVVSAGNSGPVYGSIESPGVAPQALTVGAVDKADQVASFSSRGPIPGYDGWLKPDLLAPGVQIVSTYLGGEYAAGSGTSMAAPHAAGAAALVQQLHPTWTPAQIKANLMNTSIDLGLDTHTQGAGRLQVNYAIQASGLVTPASLSFGTVDTSLSTWSQTAWLYLYNITATTQDYHLEVQTLLPESVTVSVEPPNLVLAPGERGWFSLVLAVDTLPTPPDLQRDQGWISVEAGEVSLQVPFAFQMPPIFNDSRSLSFGLQTSYGVALADLDGDGDLDAFVGNTSYYDNAANTVWFNDGDGNFSDSGQRLGSAFTWDVSLGDVDGDGDLDALCANSLPEGGQPDEIWLNDGDGYFSDSGQRLGDSLSRASALGDLDGDGDLDAFITNGLAGHGMAEADTVWLNDGDGIFSDSGQTLGNAAGLDVALGDLDGDGDLDAFIANGDFYNAQDVPNQVWLNDGDGNFSDSGQRLGEALSQGVALGDLDGDGDLDAFIANGGEEILDGQPDEVWFNAGNAIFSDSGQRLGSQSSFGAVLGDLHRDDSLDVFVAGYRGGNRVWMNDGNGRFTLSGLGFGSENAADVALGDVDGDDDLDALVANAISMPNRLWLNRSSGGLAPERLLAPSGLVANPIAGGTVYLTWTDNAPDETSYMVERSQDGLMGWVEIAILPANTQGYTDLFACCQPVYYYRLRAHRALDDVYSAYSHLALSISASHRIYIPVVWRGEHVVHSGK